MAKEKQTRRMIAMALAAAVTMSSVPVVAFADEVEGGESTGKVTVTVTATPTDNAPNATTTTTQTDISTSDTSDDGNTTTSYEGHKTETSVTDGPSDATPGTENTTDTDIDTSFDSTLGEGELSKSQTTDETTTTVEKTEDGTVETVVNEKTENSVSVDAEGNVIETTEESGSETITTTTDATEEDLENVELPEVTVDFSAENDTNPDDDKITVEVTETVEVSKAEATDVLLGNGNVGDKTVVEEIERIVKAELSSTTTTDNSTATIKPIIAPEDYDGKNYDSSDAYIVHTEEGTNHYYKDFDGLIPNLSADGNYDWGTQPDGYDFQLSGSGDATNAALPVVADVVFARDENDQLILDENNEPVIDWEATKLLATKNKKLETGMVSQASHIVVKKENADGSVDYYYTYCVDRVTPTGAKTGWYKVSDIEDANYFSEERAEKIRAIAENGYWGTDATVYETNEDGSIKVDPETGKPVPKINEEDGSVVVDPTVKGSLESIKELMRNTYDEEDTVTVKDKDGVEHTYNIMDLIDDLKEHEALACTQAAIWSYSNGCIDTLDGQDGQAIIGVQSAIKYLNTKKGEIMDWGPDYDTDSNARLQALYDCLLGLTPEEREVDLEDKEKFITLSDTQLVIGDKADKYFVVDEATGESIDVNGDDNDDNDAYNTSVQFTLAIVPSDDDNVTVAVLDKDGNMMKDAAGNPIVKRLVGENSTVDDENAIRDDGTGTYVLSGLVFQENSNVQFDLKLEGLHNLGEQGVYIFQAYGGTDEQGNITTERSASQTLVGLGERVQDVDITKSMTLKFDVDENKKVTATSTWSKSSSKTTTPDSEDPTTPPGEDNPPSGGGGDGDGPTVNINDGDVPLSDIPEEDVPLEDIADGDVPLADIPEEEVPLVAGEEEVIAATGDSNHMTAGFGGMLAALAGMFMLRRKKEN